MLFAYLEHVLTWLSLSVPSCPLSLTFQPSPIFLAYKASVSDLNSKYSELLESPARVMLTRMVTILPYQNYITPQK